MHADQSKGLLIASLMIILNSTSAVLVSRLLSILLAYAALNRWSSSNSIDPFQKMWKGIHVLFLEPRPLPKPDPWPCAF